MRRFLNVTKTENKRLAEKFSFLLMFNEDCTKDDCRWAAITVFDHWLYESNSFSIIESASRSQKQIWDRLIVQFLNELVKLEQPLKYKYIGRNTNQKIQFSRYLSGGDVGDYVCSLFDKVYHPNLVFDKLGVDLWFEDNWTIHFKYKKQEACLQMMELASKLGVFVLPAYSAEHLNDYENLAVFLKEQGLENILQSAKNIKN